LQRYFAPKAGHFSDRPPDGQTVYGPLYAFTNGMATGNDTGGDTGIDFNDAAGPNLQLAATLPVQYDFPAAGAARFRTRQCQARCKISHPDSSRTLDWRLR